MKEALLDSAKITISSKDKDIFEATGSQIKFDGFLKVYPLKLEEKELPEIKEGEILELKELRPGQHFTKPKARYNEASLIKELENNEIGRPSTYAPIIFTIQKETMFKKQRKKV